MGVIEILKPRFHPLQLNGFQNGFFNRKRDKLFGYTILSVADEMYQDLFDLFLKGNGYSSSSLSNDQDKYTRQNENGTFSYKDLEQLVEEEVFKFVSLKFYGVLHEDEWFVLNECSYFEHTDVAEIKQAIEEPYSDWENFFIHASVFQPVLEYDKRIDFEKLAERMSKKTNCVLKWPEDAGFINKNFHLILPEETPWEKIPQAAQMREFVGQPWLVAHLKQEKKSRINRAFEAYINEAVFFPLIKSLRIQKFDQFTTTEGLYGDHYPLLYPHSKEHILGVVKTCNANGQSRLFYVLYISASKQLFEWTKPDVHEVPGHHAEWILKDIKDFSIWGDEFSLHEPSVTMDDPAFWQEHVLKKHNGEFLYLKPLIL